MQVKEHDKIVKEKKKQVCVVIGVATQCTLGPCGHGGEAHVQREMWGRRDAA